MFGRLLGLVRYTSTKSTASQAISAAVPAKANINLYFWSPHPLTLFGFLNKPLFGRLSGGNTGHISMEVNFSIGKKEYISIWPSEHTEYHAGQANELTPIISSDSLETDIKLENNISPTSKSIEINESNEKKLIIAIEKLKSELEKSVSERAEWTVTKNCATYIAQILYEGGVINNKPGLIMTPRYLYYMTDKFEQENYLENLKSPSTTP